MDEEILEIIVEETKKKSQSVKIKPRSDDQYLWERKDQVSMGWWPNDDER